MLLGILTLVLAGFLALAAATPVAQHMTDNLATDKLVFCHFMVSKKKIHWRSPRPRV